MAGRTTHTWTRSTLAALWLLSSAPVAAEAPTPVDVQAKLFFKICTYDENLPPEVMRIGVAHPTADSAGGTAAANALRALEKMKVNGRRIEVVVVAFDKAPTLEAAIRDQKLYGLFVTGATPTGDVAMIRGLAKKYGLFTFAQEEGHVAAGLTAGVATEGNKRVVLLNMTVALEQGRKYDGNFIKACKVIR